ncbi:molybdopterin-dependent oxidoreductase [Amphritea pacifica]|uniref:nitrate reductase n=1 Tax=Amphritea pacifica TaxID=2811233 RepID=UPI001965A64E|nr:nitrate reductase [Amphritea pacifica]MBN1007463.1 nitrate reductase [Amphritea pacifica]
MTNTSDTCQVKTTCPYCGVGCGVNAEVSDNQLIAVSGDRDHPANQGRLCVKGSALHETTGLEGRLLEPRIDGASVSWEQAIDHVAQGFRKTIEAHGPDSVALYLSGQILTEDYYVANKLMKGFIGSANVDTNSRLCMSSAVAAHKRAFGADLVPGCYEDLELAELLILTGSNTAWAHPVIYQRIVAAKKARPEMKIVVIDPRQTATCDIADLHLPLKPGSDGYLFTGLLSYLADNDALDSTFIDNHTEGFDSALLAAKQLTGSVAESARRCGLPETGLGLLYDWFSRTEKVVTLFSQGINQSSSGVDKGNAIINCHLATGKIGKPGSAPFSITGQPNAMGGREVGGLANQLAAHMDFSDPANIELVETFWQAPNMVHQEGLKAVDMFQAVHDGRIKAIWIMGTNPVASLPDADLVREALQRCELVVVSDCIEKTDTTACANVLLPATGWAEKDGTVTNSERVISRQRGFLKPAGKSRHDWQIICSVARAMGFDAGFEFTSPGQIFTEHAALSGYRNNGRRYFDISALESLTEEQYNQLQPVRWPAAKQANLNPKRLFQSGQFNTPSGRARMVAVTPTAPVNRTSEQFPLVLNTGRIRDQWHTMTRTGKASRLLNHIDQPFVEISPEDAAQKQIADNDLVEVSNALGRCVVRANVTDRQPAGSLFMPIHWSAQFTSQARVDSLIAPICDPIAGQPESKYCPVTIRTLNSLWRGILISDKELADLPCEYWCKVPLTKGFRYELAGLQQPDSWQQWLASITTISPDRIELNSTSAYRLASFNGNQPELLFFAASRAHPKEAHLKKAHLKEALPNSAWLSKQFAQPISTAAQRMALLAGKPVDNSTDCGAIICSCFEVGEKQIQQAISQGAASTDELAAKLKCGSNCGSCLPEIRALLN